MQLLFVYGSLRAGHRNHDLISHCEFIQFDTILAKEITQHVRIPAIVHGDDVVKGEVYKVDARTMERVDELEGIDWGHYIKENVKTQGGLEVCVYFYNLEGKFGRALDFGRKLFSI